MHTVTRDFTMSAIRCLKVSAGISLIEELVQHTPTSFSAVAGLNVRGMYNLILRQWVSGRGSRPATWKELFRILKEMGLSKLAGRMEKYLRGSVPEDPPRPPPDEEGDSVEEKYGEQILFCCNETPEQEILRLNNVLVEYISANTLANNNLDQEIARLKEQLDL